MSGEGRPQIRSSKQRYARMMAQPLLHDDYLLPPSLPELEPFNPDRNLHNNQKFLGYNAPPFAVEQDENLVDILRGRLPTWQQTRGFDVAREACYEDTLGPFHNTPRLVNRTSGGHNRAPKRVRRFDGDFELGSNLPSARPKIKLPTPAIRVPRRKVLLMVLGNSTSILRVLACPDTGSDRNIISVETARRLRCKIDMEPPANGDNKFRVANGQEVEGTLWDGEAFGCVFHVFNALAISAIMGLQFLELTETYTKHKDRLIAEPLPTSSTIQINSIGRPKRDLMCRLNLFVGLANVDTGSDLDFVSERYAIARGFQVQEAHHEVMFADGSRGFTLGVLHASFTIGQVLDENTPFVESSEPIEIDLCILENLSSDILIGQTTIEELGVFNSHADSFVASSPSLGESGINIIRYIGKAEKIMTDIVRKFHQRKKENQGAAATVPR
ncbi:hypothetical protein QBC38DRAFT_521825 [Podospora fimiseda]|uniref:Uncharacterized protein n=1 Tax=Podospora fimiseda TaxID=252190 RepID=A0AAN6YMM7_9PEZI|nr:hypothetical protein QBC38DRAFT_521825 [Podospora fimiseda]